MNKKIVQTAAQDFLNSGKRAESFSFSISGNPLEMVVVRFERESLQVATESRKFEARANTISALPSGAQCGCCNGSGRA